MQSRDLSQMQWVIWVEVLETLEQVKKNPMEEQVFKGIGFRSHSFSWTLMPKSKEEALMIERIINCI